MESLNGTWPTPKEILISVCLGDGRLQINRLTGCLFIAEVPPVNTSKTNTTHVATIWCTSGGCDQGAEPPHAASAVLHHVLNTLQEGQAD